VTNALVITEDGSIVELEGQEIEPQRAEIVQHTTPARAVPMRVVEVIPTDYIWNEEKQGFFPVYGSLYGDGGKPALVRQTEHEKRQTVQAREQHAAASGPKTFIKRLLK